MVLEVGVGGSEHLFHVFAHLEEDHVRGLNEA